MDTFKLIRLPVTGLALAFVTGMGFAQDASTNAYCQTSNADRGYDANIDWGRAADNFTAPRKGRVFKVTWWGVDVDNCSPAPVAFEITYYENDGGGGCPGSVKAGPFTVTAVTDGSEWSASHTGVSVEEGETYWVEVMNLDHCDFHWLTSDDGDDNACILPDRNKSVDLAFCVEIAPFTCPVHSVATDPTTYPRPVDAGHMQAGLYGFRDEVMRQTPLGRRWIGLYYQHGATMTRILRESPRLRRRLAAFLAMIGPGLETLASGDSSAQATRIPPRAIVLLDAVIRDFEEADAGGDLAQAIHGELEALGLTQLVGTSYASAWEQMNFRGQGAFDGPETGEVVTPVGQR